MCDGQDIIFNLNKYCAGGFWDKPTLDFPSIMHFSFAYFTEISALVPVAACNGARLTVDYIKFKARHNINIPICTRAYFYIYLHVEPFNSALYIFWVSLCALLHWQLALCLVRICVLCELRWHTSLRVSSYVYSYWHLLRYLHCTVHPTLLIAMLCLAPVSTPFLSDYLSAFKVIIFLLSK